MERLLTELQEKEQLARDAAETAEKEKELLAEDLKAHAAKCNALAVLLLRQAKGALLEAENILKK